MNFFDAGTAAERYARGRPFFHPLVMEIVEGYMALNGKQVSAALDVGCGTGLSANALKRIAKRVTAVDISGAMISFAPKNKDIYYAIANAETLPFPAAEFDLVTMSQVVHWLDRQAFLADARRVLKDDGYLVIYDNYLSDEMNSNPKYQPWFRNTFLGRYPTPPRNWAAFTPDEGRAAGFNRFFHEVVENKISFTLDRFVDFLLTLTNVIAAVEGGRENVGETRGWLSEELGPFFMTNEESLTFTAPIWIFSAD